MTMARYSIARWVGIVTAARGVVWIGCGSSRGGRSCKGSASVECTAPGRPTGDTGKGQRRERPPNDINKDRCRSVSSCEVAFEHVDIKGQLVPIELWRLQHDYRIDHRRSIFLEPRH